MKRIAKIAIGVLLVFILPVHTDAAGQLIPVGKVIGLQLKDHRISVAAFDDTLGANAQNCGIKIGDILLEVNGTKIESVEDVHNALRSGDEARLTVLRGSRKLHLKMHPADTADGPKLGLYLRQGISGIGTVTWYDPETHTFGALGHGVNDSGGCLLQMAEGTAYPAEVLSVVRGKCGHPGQLKGTADCDDPCAVLYRNTPQGLFGISGSGWEGTAVSPACADQLHTGKATILSSIDDGAPREYTAEIIKIYPADRKDGRNLLIHITDPVLLEKTGGIVQGMSGSPILQDGCLVGAVTHVLVNDPTTGYGIYIGNMLDAAA